ncbi:A-kinase anchor protein 12 isoform X2 [Rhincodon typus]|uniref:A-kinase anchor protein 12 isoform X2 n=1 Tax=Rhincodon typus TaxID=259920 RepID=UPI00203026C1|nr:A-kinase anchor protein 12 isoform X2 [Rhincodon typus]
MPGAVTATVEPPSITQEEEPVEMDLEQKETLPAKTKDEEPRDSQEDASPPVEIGEEAQAGEIGFKKVFKFVGCKFTVKKENPVKLEPVQLLTVKKDEDGEADGESKQEMGGLKNGDLSPAAHEAEGSPPEVLTPGETEESTDQVEPKPTVAEEPVESVVSPVESPAMDSPLKRFFRQGFFSVLRRKPSFKKAKDEPLVVGEKPEVNGEQVVAAGNVNGEEGDRGPSKEPSALPKDAEILGAHLVEERERDDDFEDLSVELAKVREAEERLMGEGSVSAVDDRQPCPEMKMAAPALEMGQAAQLTVQSPSAERPVKPEFAPVEVSAELQAGQTDVGPDRTQVKAPEPIVGEAELLSSQEKAKLQGSPLKKLFTSSSIKKLSGKKPKAAKGESKPGDDDEEARLQSSTESEGSPDGQKADTPPLTSPEDVDGTVPAETAEATNLEVEGMNEAADGERKKESITAWASFKKLVTSKKRPKVLSENDREDEQTEKVKGVAASSNESASAVPAELQEEAKLNAEDLSLERSTEDPKKKADAPVSWEALICVGSSKKRARKLSDSEAPQLDEELQRSPEGVAQVLDGAEELRASVPQDTDQDQGRTSPEGAVSSPVEGDVSDGAVSTWESFKRLVTSRRKSKSKLEDRADESVTVVAAAEVAVPETEQQAKEESWASLKKLIPGRRKKRSDAKADQPPAEDVGKETKQAEMGVSKGDEESDTPAVVPLSEYDAVEEERAAKEQQLTVGMNAVHKDDVLTKSGAPAEGGELSAGQAVTMDRGALESIKSSIDERSPSWISTAVSDIIEKRVEDEGKIVEEIVEARGQAEHGDAASLAEQARTICPNEIAKEAPVSSEVAVALEYPAEESLTEETAEMVSAVSQLTETPVTTAESTPVPDDEVTVTRQTHEVLQEAAERVKLSARPLAPPRKAAAAPEIPGSERDSTEKVQEEAVETLSETEMSEPAGKGETGKSDAPSASEGTIQVADNEIPQLERLEQTKCETIEVSAAQSIESETIPPPEKFGEPLSLVHQTHVETVCEAETGISEPGVKVVMDQTETGLEETLKVSQAEDVLKTQAPLEKPKAAQTSCREKVLTEDEEPIKAVTAEVPGKLEVEQLAECGDVTDGIPTESAEKAILEQTAIAEVAHQMAVGNVEAVSEETIGNSHEIVEEVGTEERVIECRETLASTKEAELVSEQSTKIIPVNVEMNAAAAGVCEESIGVTPVVTVTELCSKETVQMGPDVRVSQVGLSEETIEVTPVVTVMHVVPSEETVKDASDVEVTEAGLCEETKQTTPVVEMTEVLPGEQTTDKISPEMTAAVCTEQTDASPVALVTETVRGEETDGATPVATVTETGRGEEADGATPVAVVTETVRGEGAITKQEEIVHTMVTNDKIVQEQIKTVQKVVDAHDPVVSIAEDVGTEMSGAVCKEMMSIVSRVREQGTKEQIVEMLTSPKEVLQQESNIAELSKETIQTSVTERTVIEVVKNMETEVGGKFEVAHLEGAVKETHVELQSETGVIELTQVGREVDQYLTKEEPEPDPTVAMLSKEKFEVLPDRPIGKTDTMELAATEVVESEAKEHETQVSCVTGKPPSIATGEAVDTNENISLQQESPTVELVQKVGDELSAVEKDQPTPEVEFESAHTDGELVQDVQLDGEDVVVPKQCEASEKADEAQKGDGVELANGATEKHLSKLESPGELPSSEASAEGCTEEPKLEVVPESEGVTLGSEVKLHSGSIDEFQTVQSETVTLTTEPSVAESSESREVAFPVTAAAVEEQVIAETVGSVVTQLPELRAVDQLIPAAEPDVIVHGPVVETAAAIVEVAIDAAAGTLADSAVESEVDSTVDGQKQQSSSTEQLVAGLVNHRTEGAEQKLVFFEMETDVEVSQTRTMEQSSTMIAEDPMKGVIKSTERTEEQVDPVSSEQDKDSEKMYKDAEEKMPEVQMISTEGKDDEIVDQSAQTQDSKGTEALEHEVVVIHSTEMVSEETIEGDQKPLETEDMASVEMERETNESVILPDGSKVTEVECCQSLKSPEGRPPSLELTEEKGQSVKASQQDEKQTSIQDVQDQLMLTAEEKQTPKVADEKLESDVMESIDHKNDKESDKKQTIEAVEKQESQEMQIGHQMDQSSTLESVKAATEQTTS